MPTPIARQEANDTIRRYATSVLGSHRKQAQKVMELMTDGYLVSSDQIQELMEQQQRAALMHELSRMAVAGDEVAAAEKIGAKVLEILVRGWEEGRSTSIYANAESASKRTAYRWFLETIVPLAERCGGGQAV